MTACAKVILGQQPNRLKSVKPSPKAIETVQKVIEVHSKYWDCLRPLYIHPLKDVEDSAKEVIKLSDIILKYRMTVLFERYKMCSIPISADWLKEKFKGSVACSMKALQKKGTLYFYVHDQPEVRGMMQSKENILKLGDTVMVRRPSIYMGGSLLDPKDCFPRSTLQTHISASF